MPSRPASSIPASSLDFLLNLKENNNRDWFNDHKADYLEQHRYIEAFADALLREMNTHDQIETPTGKHALQRIYRDTRFSKDKTPYKTNWSGGFKRATKFRRVVITFILNPATALLPAVSGRPTRPTLNAFARRSAMTLLLSGRSSMLRALKKHSAACRVSN